MSFQTASAFLRGGWLIEPSFAKAQLPLIVSMINGTFRPDQTTAVSKKEASLPRRTHFTGIQTDVFKVNPYSSADRLPYNSIVMIDIIGPVLKYGDICSYGTVQYNDLLIRMGNSDRVKGIVLNIDSPGGQADGTGMITDTIREVSKQKPVLSVIQDGMAASAGMWIAAAGQEIYVTRATSQVGSIGAYCTIADYAGWFEDNGIKLHEIYAPQSIDKNKEYKDALKGDYSLIENELKFLVEDFKSSVRKNRGGRLKMAGEEPFTGKMYSAKEAIKLGLIDGVRPLAGVIKRMEELIALRA